MKIIEIPNCFKKQTTLCFEVKEQRLVSLLHFFFNFIMMTIKMTSKSAFVVYVFNLKYVT